MNIERKPVNYGRGGEGHVDLEKAKEANRLKLLKGSDKYQEGKAALEFLGTLKKENSVPGEKRTAEINVQEQMRAGINSQENKSFPTMFKGFSSDVTMIRKMVAQYDELKNEHLREIKGEEILIESEKIGLEIFRQIEIAKDPQEKADFDNLRLELGNITKNVSGLMERKVVNG